MPVNNITGLPGSSAQPRTESSQVQVGRSEPSAKQQETGRPSSVDTVSLTDTSAQLRKLEQTLATLPVVDTERVEQIRSAIAQGTFEIDPARIAQKLAALERELSPR